MSIPEFEGYNNNPYVMSGFAAYDLSAEPALKPDSPIRQVYDPRRTWRVIEGGRGKSNLPNQAPRLNNFSKLQFGLAGLFFDSVVAAGIVSLAINPRLDPEPLGPPRGLDYDSQNNSIELTERQELIFQLELLSQEVGRKLLSDLINVANFFINKDVSQDELESYARILQLAYPDLSELTIKGILGITFSAKKSGLEIVHDGKAFDVVLSAADKKTVSDKKRNSKDDNPEEIKRRLLVIAGQLNGIGHVYYEELVRDLDYNIAMAFVERDSMLLSGISEEKCPTVEEIVEMKMKAQLGDITVDIIYGRYVRFMKRMGIDPQARANFATRNTYTNDPSTMERFLECERRGLFPNRDRNYLNTEINVKVVGETGNEKYRIKEVTRAGFVILHKRPRQPFSPQDLVVVQTRISRE